MDNKGVQDRVRVGYQNCSGSFNEKAAKLFIQFRSFPKYSLVSLFSAQAVAGALLRKEVDVGIVAFRHDHAGYDMDTATAFKRFNRSSFFSEVGEYALETSYSLFGYKQTMPYRIEKIMGTLDSIKLTKKTLQRLCGKVQFLSATDVSVCAKYISQGFYGEKLALITTPDTAVTYNLSPIANNICDHDKNRTIYKAVTLSDHSLARRSEQIKPFKTPIVITPGSVSDNMTPETLEINNDKLQT